MVSVSEPIEDSILNTNDAGLDDAQQIEELNEDQINALLDGVQENEGSSDKHQEENSVNEAVVMGEDPLVAPNDTEPANNQEDAGKEVEVNKIIYEVVEEEVVIEDDDDDDILVISNENSVPDSTRKRPNRFETVKSPVSKKKRRPFRPYISQVLAARRLIVGILGSIDVSKEPGHNELIKLTGIAIRYRNQYKQAMHTVQMLKRQLDQAREETRAEQIAHAGTWKNLEKVITQTVEMRQELAMANMMATIKMREPHVTARSRHNEQGPMHPKLPYVPMVPRNHQNQPTIVHTGRLNTSTPVRKPVVLVPKATPKKPELQETSIPKPNGQHVVVNRQVLPQPQPSEQYHQQQVVNLIVGDFTYLTSPGSSYGHSFAPTNGDDGQSLIDMSDQTGQLRLNVPLVDPKHITPALHNRNVAIPHIFSESATNPHLTVSIRSGVADFVENWAIGGRINYEGVTDLKNKEIQLFVQFASLKRLGMVGKLRNGRDRLRWGCSKVWPCCAKAHKFRITLHKDQMIPKGDAVHLFAVVKSTDTHVLEKSSVVTLVLDY